MWVVLPVRVGRRRMAGLVLVLGFAADWIASSALALQADALAVAVAAGLAGWDLWHSDWNHRTPLLDRGCPALLRHATQNGRWCSELCAAAYSWAAAIFLPVPRAFDIFKLRGSRLFSWRSAWRFSKLAASSRRAFFAGRDICCSPPRSRRISRTTTCPIPYFGAVASRQPRR